MTVTLDHLVALENASIRSFVSDALARHLVTGRLLDYGCGRQPYRPLVEAAGVEYVGFDRAEHPVNRGGDIGDRYDSPWSRASEFDAVLCTQVVQFVERPLDLFLGHLAYLLRPGGLLILTYPTTWPIVNDEDLWRFTEAGMGQLLDRAGFDVLESRERLSVAAGEINLPVGYGTVARPRATS